jgi:hypothetical protein
MAVSCECGGDLVIYKTDTRATCVRCEDCGDTYEGCNPPE